jgi:hypothetical protein
MLAAHTRIIDIKPHNRVKKVTKQADGGLMVELHSGQTFTLSKDDELFQAFIVYSVLAEL